MPTSPSPSARASCWRRSEFLLDTDAAGATVDARPAGSWSSTTPRPTSRSWRPALARQGYEVITAKDGDEALSVARAQTPDLIPRRRDAGQGRHPGLPGAQGGRAPAVHADHPGDHEGRSGRHRGRARCRRRRVHHQAGRPCGARGAGALDPAHQGAARCRPGAGGPARGVEPHPRAAGRGAAGRDRAAGSLKRLPVAADRRASSPPATSTCSKATAGRSRWCSATCAGSPRSPRPASPRR